MRTIFAGSGGGEPVSHLVTNVSVSLNVNVTNNNDGAGLTDAVLVINENNCTAPVALGGMGIGPRLPTQLRGRSCSSR